MSVNQNHASLPGFDRTALRVNQAVMIVLLLVAFIADLPWLAAATAIIMALGTIDFIKIRFDFWTAFCVSAKFGSYAARNMFP